MDIYSYLDAIDPTSYVGVDALTFTAKDAISITGLISAIQSLSDRLEIEDTKPFKYMGAKGWTKGPVAYAMKQSAIGKTIWAIMMVRGPMAQEVMRYKIFDLRATRVDLRIDIQMSKQCKDLAKMYYTVANNNDAKQAKLISSLTGDTFYPETNRSATYYARLYDKSAEYGQDLGNVWRYEVEIKRDAADQIADILLECHDIEDFITQSVFGIMKEQWAMPVPGIGVKPKINYVGISSVTTEKKLDWLRRNVAPSVAKLSAIGFGDEAMAALGIVAETGKNKAKNDICTNSETWEI